MIITVTESMFPGPIYLPARQGAITNAINTGRRETLALTIFFLKHLKKYFNLHLIVSVKHLHDIIHKGWGILIEDGDGGNGAEGGNVSFGQP